MDRYEFHVTVYADTRLGKELASFSSGRDKSRRIQELATEALYAAAVGVMSRAHSAGEFPRRERVGVPPIADESSDLPSVSMGFMNQLESIPNVDQTEMSS
ncbi:MAG: hypothetical protein ING56_13345 [Rhodocyclaceae bacterium]|nr:hypothetical protein [Rhodocyclaceae bacterium]MCA3082866.1 hypothetical protein [Rhodocyclaceae bacterium]